MSNIRNEAKRSKQLTDRKDAIRNMSPMPESERRKFNITHAKKGSYIHIGEKDYLVEGVSQYVEHNWKLSKKKDFASFELDLLCLDTGERSGIEWEKDDVVEVSVTSSEINMSEISGGNIQEIRENEAGSIFHNGKDFFYEDDWAALYYRDCGDTGIRVRFYEFEAKDGTCLTIEEWMDGPPEDPNTELEYEGFLSHGLDQDEITILQVAP